MKSTHTFDVWMLSRHDGRNMYALAFSSLDDLLDYARDYYYEDAEDMPPMPEAGESLDEWLAALGDALGMDFAIDHDTIAVQLEAGVG